MHYKQCFCSIAACGKSVKAKGFCRYHYENFHRHGDPLKTKSMRKSPGERTAEDRRAARRADYRKHTERYKNNAKYLYEKNKDKRLQQSREWKKSNPEAAALMSRMAASKRNAKKKMATPPWLTDDHLLLIRSIYEEAIRLTKETGIPYEVDHIVPLSGKTVSGLHVPWNLRAIPAQENNRRPRIWDHNQPV